MYVPAKRPFKLAVLWSVIPPTEWNMLDVIASKIPETDTGKPWICLEKIKEHYVGVSTLMQTGTILGAKMSQASQSLTKHNITIISVWPNTANVYGWISIWFQCTEQQSDWCCWIHCLPFLSSRHGLAEKFCTNTNMHISLMGMKPVMILIIINFSLAIIILCSCGIIIQLCYQ